MTDMTPLWLDRPRATHPTLTSPATYDVVVAGAGVVGLLTGLLFARAGRRVAVLEARRVGDGTTGHTTAKISLLQGTKLSRAARTNPPSVVRDYVTANQEGQSWLRDFCSAHDVPYQDRPAYTYATSRVGELRARAELSVAGLAGLDATWVEETELPYQVRGAVRLADQMQLHPLDLLDALVAQLIAEGGELFEHTRLTDVQNRGGSVTVTTEQTIVTANHVVLATAQPVLRRHGFFARLHPQRSYAAALRSPWVPHGMYLSADQPTRSLRSLPVPGGDELLLVGGSGHVTGRAASEAGHLDELLGWARATFGGEVTHTWSAQDHGSVTALPYVGPMFPGRVRHLGRHRLRQVGPGGRPRSRPAAHQDHPRQGRSRGAATLAPGVQQLDAARDRGRASSRPVQRRGRSRADQGRRTTAVAGRRTCRPGRPWHLHPPRWPRALERRRAVVGLPAARLPVRQGRLGARGPGGVRAQEARADRLTDLRGAVRSAGRPTQGPRGAARHR